MSDNNSLEDIINNLPDYNPWDSLCFGEEIFHISNKGEVRQVDISSEEGQQVLDKLYDR